MSISFPFTKSCAELVTPHSRWFDFELFLGSSVLYAVCFLGALCIVESVKRAYQVAGYAADTLERDLLFLTVAAGALVVDDAGVAALRVAVYRVLS